MIMIKKKLRYVYQIVVVLLVQQTDMNAPVINFFEEALRKVFQGKKAERFATKDTQKWLDKYNETK